VACAVAAARGRGARALIPFRCCCAGLCPQPFVPSFAFCGGPGGIFPNFENSYPLGPISFNVFEQVSGTAVWMTGADAGCVVSPGNPLGRGAFSISVAGGKAVAGPEPWFVPPHYCHPV
jgi:hypothetical protein